MEQGVPEWRSWILAYPAKDGGECQVLRQANEAMPIQWFQQVGLINLTNRYLLLHR
jgi:hypothetical protein